VGWGGFIVANLLLGRWVVAELVTAAAQSAVVRAGA
jgi:hypothetical protein